MTQEDIAIAENTLKQLDPILGGVIESQILTAPEMSDDYFAALCKSIIGQQVSVAAARTIYNRFVEVTELSPSKVALMSEADIKQIGLSGRKASYVKDLAGRFVENPTVYNHLERQSDDDVISELILVKGIGVWTAQMFLIFTLGRQDVFAPDDVGLQRAMMKLHDWDELPTKSALIDVSMKWSPYRSVACLHLWRYLDNAPS